MSDFLSNRFHEKKKVIMAIASVFILVFFAVYAGSCFVTCGKLFSKLFGQNYQLMMVVGALFVLLTRSSAASLPNLRPTSYRPL